MLSDEYFRVHLLFKGNVGLQNCKCHLLTKSLPSSPKIKGTVVKGTILTKLDVPENRIIKSVFVTPDAGLFIFIFLYCS